MINAVGFKELSYKKCQIKNKQNNVPRYKQQNLRAISLDNYIAFAGLFRSKKPVLPPFEPYQVVESIPKEHFNDQRVHKVDDNLYRGGRPYSEEGVKELKKLGIKTVVCLLRKDVKYPDPIASWKVEHNLVKNYGMNFVHLEMDEGQKPSARTVNNFMDLFKDGKNQPVYLHCSAGQDRAGILSAIYDVEVLGKSFDQAYERYISQNHDFMSFTHLDQFLYDYCINKGQNPEDFHPKEVLEKWFDKSWWTSWAKDNKEEYIAEVTKTIEANKSFL